MLARKKLPPLSWHLHHRDEHSGPEFLLLYAMGVVGEVPIEGLLVVKLLFSKEGVQERINEYLIKVIILHIFSALLILQNEELSPRKVQKF